MLRRQIQIYLWKEKLCFHTLKKDALRPINMKIFGESGSSRSVYEQYEVSVLSSRMLYLYSTLKTDAQRPVWKE